MLLSLLSAKLTQLSIMLGILSVSFAAIIPSEYEISPPSVEVGIYAQEEVESPVQTRIEPTTLSQGRIRDIIVRKANIYGVSQRLALFIAEKESRFSPSAINPTSGAGGLFQWLKSSFLFFCEGDRFDIEDNADCAITMLSEPNGIRHWSADKSMRRLLINEGLIECFEGKNNCYLL